MKGLNQKQREILVDIFSKVAVYLATVALIGGVIEKKVDYVALLILLLLAILLISIMMYIVKED
ncbi:MAG: hypothetical protein HQ591_13280 [candidate division Zixibacteria bacterium]|nr:hypothetical protein [Candidatus Tariuqbacter arcticus]